MIDELILITKHFPFNPLATPGESFLCNEIKVLSEHAKRIWIMSTEAVHTQRPKVNLPENVHAYALSAFGTKADKLVCMAEGLTCAVHAPAFVREERANKPLKARAYLYYFYMRGRQKYRRIRRVLEGKTLGKNILIYSYWFYDHAYAAAALKRQLASAHDVCCFSRAHRYDLYEYIHRFSGGLEYIPLRRWLLENLDEVRPCSDYGTNYLKSCYPKYGQKIRTAYIGTQDHGLNPACDVENRISFCSCSRVIAVKRVDKLIESLGILVRRGFALNWTHFGDGPLYEEMRAKAANSLKRRGWSMPGRVDNSDVMAHYQKEHVDFFVNTSESEGLPISIMEAASFGIPVIATDVGGTSEIVRDGETGFLLNRDFTGEDLANAVEKWNALPAAQKDAMRERARKMWEENFEYKRNADRVIRELEARFES